MSSHPGAANILDEALYGEASRNDLAEEEGCDTQVLQDLSHHWPSEHFSLQLSLGSCSGVGVGSRKQHRTRVARLALALNLLMRTREHRLRLREMFHRYEGLEPLVDGLYAAPEVLPSKPSADPEPAQRLVRIVGDGPDEYVRLDEISEGFASDLPPPPSLEENYDFAASLMTFHRGRVLVFNTPLGQVGRMSSRHSQSIPGRSDSSSV